jgi:hypothetical protein
MEAFLVKYDDIDGVYAGDDNMGVGALNAAKAAGREGIIFVGATNFAVGYEAMERGDYWGSIYQSPVDDAEAALKPRSTVLNGEDVPFLNYFDTPKITQDNMGDFTSRSSDPGISSRGAVTPPRAFNQNKTFQGDDHGPCVWAFCIVTGAAQGIGRAIGEALVREGANVCFADINGAKVPDVAAAKSRLWQRQWRQGHMGAST